MSNNKDLNLKSIDVLDKYIAHLTKEQDELYTHLNFTLNNYRHLKDYDEWDDKNHLQFSENFITKIDSNYHRLFDSYEEAISRLKELKSFYSQISN